MALVDESETYWYGSVQVGTPPVSYTVNFDTYVVFHSVLVASCASIVLNWLCYYMHVYPLVEAATFSFLRLLVLLVVLTHRTTRG
jgi:hypothetical protein